MIKLFSSFFVVRGGGTFFQTDPSYLVKRRKRRRGGGKPPISHSQHVLIPLFWRRRKALGNPARHHIIAKLRLAGSAVLSFIKHSSSSRRFGMEQRQQKQKAHIDRDQKRGKPKGAAIIITTKKNLTAPKAASTACNNASFWALPLDRFVELQQKAVPF